MKFLKMIIRIINPYVWYLSYRQYRANKRSKTVSAFAHKHKELLVIVLDPVEDTLFMSHRDVQVLNKIKTVDGKNHHIVKRVIKASTFKSNIDYLITALAEGLKVSLSNQAVTEFFHWVDGAAYRIGQMLRERKEKRLEREKNASN